MLELTRSVKHVVPAINKFHSRFQYRNSFLSSQHTERQHNINHFAQRRKAVGASIWHAFKTCGSPPKEPSTPTEKREALEKEAYRIKRKWGGTDPQRFKSTLLERSPVWNLHFIKSWCATKIWKSYCN